MTVTLLERGVSADKSSPDGGKTYTLQVDDGDMVRAMQVLREKGLPHSKFDDLGSLFKKDGLVSTPSRRSGAAASSCGRSWNSRRTCSRAFRSSNSTDREERQGAQEAERGGRVGSPDDPQRDRLRRPDVRIPALRRRPRQERQAGQHRRCDARLPQADDELRAVPQVREIRKQVNYRLASYGTTRAISRLAI